jgi:hypothetical protein
MWGSKPVYRELSPRVSFSWMRTVAKLLGKVPTTSDMAALSTRVDFSWEDVYECVRMDNSRLPYLSIANLNHHSGAVPAALTA